eukprot:jgi/Botrbrau1/7597/Bobra.0159s0046.1
MRLEYASLLILNVFLCPCLPSMWWVGKRPSRWPHQHGQHEQYALACVHGLMLLGPVDGFLYYKVFSI